MRKITAVIGSGFGDEGKGLITDYLCSQSNVDLCVRYNGGAQAAHTVELSDGTRHVFHHFGSGTFNAVPTYLSRFFICNPITFMKEREELILLDRWRDAYVFVNKLCLITTPWDMLINQWSETARGQARHGSCGMGIHETIERCQQPGYSLTVANLTADRRLLRAFLDNIRHGWVPQRLSQLGITLSPEQRDLILSDGLMENFIEDCESFMSIVAVTQGEILKKIDHAVFEGAQGLMLDQDYGTFPHVTRSNTGLKNVMWMADTYDAEEIDAVYVTRTFLTRHGAGPLRGEGSWPEFFDATNVPNDWQGALRYAPLDLEAVETFINMDLRNHGLGRVTPKLAMTWCDVVDPSLAKYYFDHLARHTGATQGWMSYGPTRSTVKETRYEPTAL